MDFGRANALETDERFKLRHGEAVAIDCVPTMIANVQGHLSGHAQRVLRGGNAAIGLFHRRHLVQTAKRAARGSRSIATILQRPPASGCARHGRMSDEDIDKAFAKLEAFIDEHPETKWNLGWSFAAA